MLRSTLGLEQALHHSFSLKSNNKLFQGFDRHKHCHILPIHVKIVSAQATRRQKCQKRKKKNIVRAFQCVYSTDS